MPTPAYMMIQGTSQGAIHELGMSPESVGRASKQSQVNSIQILGFGKVVKLPVDELTGQPTGRRVHQGFKVLKEFDRATPMLHRALASGERLNEVRIEWYRTTEAGTEEHYFTHLFENVTIVRIEQKMPNCLDPESASIRHMEEVGFAYKRVTWTHEISGTQGHDDWDAS